jgi:uncharacterized iron-regulated membrane protein
MAELSSMHQPDIKKIAAGTRRHRSIHKWLAPISLVLLCCIGISGLLLAWKKHSGGWLMAENVRGSNTDMRSWLPIDSLDRLATAYLRDSINADLSPEKDRIEIRPDKGMVKFTFTGHYHALQIDASNGRLLKKEVRRADWIERLHDGSLIDRMIGWKWSAGKLIFSSIAGVSLIILAVTGGFLWWNPRRTKRIKSAGR